MRQVFRTTDSDIPAFLHALFYELHGQKFRKGANLKEILRDPARDRITIGEVFSAFLTMIADTRHAGIYIGAGINPSLTEAVVNGDDLPARGEAGELARAMAAFAYALLACARCLADVEAAAVPQKTTRRSETRTSRSLLTFQEAKHGLSPKHGLLPL